MTKLAEKIWEEGSDEVLIKAFENGQKTRSSGANKSSNVRTYSTQTPRLRGSATAICGSVLHDVIELIQRTEADSHPPDILSVRLHPRAI